MQVRISNTSSSALPLLQLSLNSYQDHQNGNTTYRSDGVVAPAGAMSLTIPKVSHLEGFVDIICAN